MKVYIEELQKSFSPETIIRALSPYLTEQRKQRIAQVVQHRSRWIIPVAERFYDLGNMYAILRTAEGLGLLEFHYIPFENPMKYSKRIAQGAYKWLKLHRWECTQEAIHYLKAQGYRVVATALDKNAQPFTQLTFQQPTAIIFGNEHEGITNTAMQLADVVAYFPMVGFTQSFNVSVAAALCLFHAIEKSKHQKNFYLSVDEQQYWKAQYYLQSCKNAVKLLRKHVSDSKQQSHCSVLSTLS